MLLFRCASADPDTPQDSDRLAMCVYNRLEELSFTTDLMAEVAACPLKVQKQYLTCFAQLHPGESQASHHAAAGDVCR